MEPTIREGDVMVANTEDVKRAIVGVFVVNRAGEFTVKRLKYDLREHDLRDAPQEKQPIHCQP